MMDYNVVSTERYFAYQDECAEEACVRTARRNGIPQDRAEGCDMGIYNCVGCPWDNFRIENAFRNNHDV